jgi:hypothetical protein
MVQFSFLTIIQNFLIITVESSHFIGKQTIFLKKPNIGVKNLHVPHKGHLEMPRIFKKVKMFIPGFCLLYLQNKVACFELYWFNAFVLFVSNTFVTLVLLFWTSQFVPLYQGSYYLKYEDRIFLLSDETKYVYSVISLAMG